MLRHEATQKVVLVGSVSAQVVAGAIANGDYTSAAGEFSGPNPSHLSEILLEALPSTKNVQQWAQGRIGKRERLVLKKTRGPREKKKRTKEAQREKNWSSTMA